MGQQFGDTSLTKVFVGGLAWETQGGALREHFEKYGDILEAVIISDKVTGRSKGYGFVTFKEAEEARRACEDPTPMINGRRANCNLASLGARRTKTSPPATPVVVPAHQPAGRRTVSNAPPPQWYYAPAAGTPQPPPSAVHHYPAVLPYYAAGAAYGYPPSYMTDLGYNPKLSPTATAGSYVQGQYYPAAAQGGMVAPSAMMPYYPMYPYHHHSQAMAGVHGHFFPPTTSGTIATITRHAFDHSGTGYRMQLKFSRGKV
ncbi:probable RNA-binding protein ARP1 isoform X2 [Asparagus officinalis]|uniref:probable RNA-binding protein ARP1 isoform X2 n=1 Tax=Asparagus officinalis TaxID=4686 RepID=UPI00098DFA01|nr:probable RNA-binding protein ARP1 isoform X2 [Asparagus officinalis]